MNKCVRELCKNNVSLVTMHWIKLQIKHQIGETIPWFNAQSEGEPAQCNRAPFKQQQ